MMQTRVQEWKVLPYNQRFSIFIRSCQAKAGDFAKMRHGAAIIQICLYNECGHKTLQAILFSLTVEASWGDGTKAEKETRHSEGDVK